MNVTLVSADRERAVIIRALRRLGAGESEAASQAEQLVEADLRARPSHGLHRLSVIAARIERGVLRPGARIHVDWRSVAFVLVDGGGGFGPHVALRALALARERCLETGVCVIGVRNAGHLGMLAPYVEGLASERLIGIALTTSEALVHPAGGVRALLGTNPIAVGIPVDPDPPFVLDMSTAAISMGEVIARMHAGEGLPPGVAIDREGLPTTDPAAARHGALSPFGHGKGYGLALAIELLVASLSNSAFGTAVRGTLDVAYPVTKGDLFILLDPIALGAESWLASARDYLRELRTSPPAVGVEAVLVPGDRARLERARRLRTGCPIVTDVWQDALRLAGGSRAEANVG